MTSSFAKRAIVLGLLCAVGPFAIDMYLPALPTITADLKTTTAATQMSLVAFMVAAAFAQVFYGPLSDMLGRKRPLYFGLGLFAIGGLGCMFAPSIEWLIFFRFVQGVGATAGMVIPRAVVRDLHTGHEAAKLMALIMLVFSVSPILAPMIGSQIIALGGWRGVFLAISAVALCGALLLTFAMEETHPPERRVRSSLQSVLFGYGILLRDGHFLGLCFIGGLGMASFFSFLATSSFVYIDHFGLTPTQYSLAFSVNAIGFIGAAQASAPLARRFSFPRVVVTALTVYAVLAAILFLLTMAGADNLFLLAGMLFAAFAALGLVIPSTAVLALEEHGPIAGMASALMGTLQMVSGVAVMALTSLFFDGTPLPMVTAIVLCSLSALTIGFATLGGRRRVSAPAE